MIERTPEQHEILGAFLDLLSGPTGDGASKRAAGVKPLWKVDESHEAAAERHWLAWRSGELVDRDSGCHPLQHVAWRCLAIAYQEIHACADVHTLQTQETQPVTGSGVFWGPPTVEAGSAH